MKANMRRSDAYYEIVFNRPSFASIGSFAQIIEPIHDALSEELVVPSDAIKVETGNSIENSAVTVNLLAGNVVFEARLDGYKAHFLNLRNPGDFNFAERCTRNFANAVSAFLSDGKPALCRMVTSSWLNLEGGVNSAEELVASLTSLSGNPDPFRINSTKTTSRVKFDCLNIEELWSIALTLEKSALPGTDLFLEVGGEYLSESTFSDFDSRITHMRYVSAQIASNLKLESE